jgi:hypothetical protein
MYENIRMKLVEIVLRRREKEDEGINLTCKYHNVSPAQLLHVNKIF